GRGCLGLHSFVLSVTFVRLSAPTPGMPLCYFSRSYARILVSRAGRQRTSLRRDTAYPFRRCTSFRVPLFEGAQRSVNSKSEPDAFLPDICGIHVMTSSWETIEGLDRAYLEYAKGNGDPHRCAQQAIDADPSCTMAYCVKGLLAALEGLDPAIVAESLAAAEASLSFSPEEGEEGNVEGGQGAGGARGPWQREQVFVEALRAWAFGRFREGALLLETWLMKVPVDLPALKFAQDAHITLGDGANARDCVARVLPYWPKTAAGYPCVLGMHAFGLAETGAYLAAEESADTALAMGSDNMWALHAMSQAYELEARASEGCSLLTQQHSDWEKGGSLAPRVAWNLGIFQLERGMNRRAQGTFDRYLCQGEEQRRRQSNKGLGGAPPPHASVVDLTDATNLLWRMDILGVDTGVDRWKGLAEAWHSHETSWHSSTLRDMHALMCYASMAYMPGD
ncbi:unnamed protein product, partial [Discosporangium mesarthrocarpum]